MKILIKVSKEVLERSKMCGIIKKYKSDSCAVALAVIDLFPYAKVGYTGLWFITSINDFDQKSYTEIPIEAVEFINLFDRLEPGQRVLMTPFSFEIKVPEYVIEKIGLNQIYKVLSESRTLEHVNH